MGKKKTIHLVLHFPESEEGRQELSRRAAQIHAESILERIEGLHCPLEQKRKLLDAVIADTREKSDQGQKISPV